MTLVVLQVVNFRLLSFSNRIIFLFFIFFLKKLSLSFYIFRNSILFKKLVFLNYSLFFYKKQIFLGNWFYLLLLRFQMFEKIKFFGEINSFFLNCQTLSSKNKKWTILRSAFIYNKAKTQFEIRQFSKRFSCFFFNKSVFRLIKIFIVFYLKQYFLINTTFKIVFENCKII